MLLCYYSIFSLSLSHTHTQSPISFLTSSYYFNFSFLIFTSFSFSCVLVSFLFLPFYCCVPLFFPVSLLINFLISFSLHSSTYYFHSYFTISSCILDAALSLSFQYLYSIVNNHFIFLFFSRYSHFNFLTYSSTYIKFYLFQSVLNPYLFIIFFKSSTVAILQRVSYFNFSQSTLALYLFVILSKVFTTSMNSIFLLYFSLFVTFYFISSTRFVLTLLSFNPLGIFLFPLSFSVSLLYR